MVHDIYISYAEEDEATARTIYESLKEADIRPWMSPQDVLPGQDWHEAVIGAIEESAAMVLVFSSHANHSQRIKRELERAINKDITLIPFRIEDAWMSRSMEYFLSTTHWLDAIEPPLQDHLEHLAETLKFMLSRSSTPEEVIERSMKQLNAANLENAGLEPVHLKEGQYLFRQGASGDSMYVLLNGDLDIRVNTADGTETCLATVTPTAIIGEMSLFLEKPRTAAVVARTEANLWEVSHSVFATALSRRDQWAVTLLLCISQIMARRVDEMNIKLTESRSNGAAR